MFHYLDDLAITGSPNSTECDGALHTLQKLVVELGIPLVADKQDGPTMEIVFLGIVKDTLRQELRLPKDKLERLLATVAQWETRKACTRRELESLIGTLQHAYKVIPAGRSFMRRAISLLSTAHQQHHHIRLNTDFRLDMAWWSNFAKF